LKARKLSKNFVVIVKGNFNYIEIKDFLLKVDISKNPQNIAQRKPTYTQKKRLESNS